MSACYSLQVGDIVSVIDMPPKEDTTWWRGKHGFQVRCSQSTLKQTRTFFPSGCKLLIWLVFEVFKDKELLCKVNFKYLRVCWKAKGDTNPPSCEALGEITWVNSYSYAVCIYIVSHVLFMVLSFFMTLHDFLLVLKILHVSWREDKTMNSTWLKLKELCITWQSQLLENCNGHCQSVYIESKLTDETKQPMLDTCCVVG